MDSKHLPMIRRVIAREGGFVDDPDDPGGATNMGVTQPAYDAWRKKQGKAVRPVKSITEDEVTRVYNDAYLAAPRFVEAAGENLALLEILFDSAVNHGPGQAVKWLQRSVGTKADGIIGPRTVEKTRDALKMNKRQVYLDVLTRRYEYYGSIITSNRKPYYKFARGWMKRMSFFTYNVIHV